MMMMIFTAAVLPVLFTVSVADTTCMFFKTSSGEFRPITFCGYPWNNEAFCCGTCNHRYCCSNPLKKLSKAAQNNCFLGGFTDLGKLPPTRADYNALIAICVTIGGLAVFFFVLFLTCCVCPSCYLYKKCRNTRPVMATTVVTTQQPPQQTVINGGLYQQYQPVPTTPYQGYPAFPGPPPPYQEAGYPAPNNQPPYTSDQATYPVHPPAPSGFPTDYNSQPAFNPAYVELTKITK